MPSPKIERYLPKPTNAFGEWFRSHYTYETFGNCCGTQILKITKLTRKEILDRFNSKRHLIMLAYGRVGKQQDSDGITIKHIKTKNGPITIRGRYEW